MSLPAASPLTAPVKWKASSRIRCPVAFASKVTLALEAAPNSIVPVPLISAVPDPVTSASAVTVPPFAHSRPELAIALSIMRPPLPVASSVPAFVITLAPHLCLGRPDRSFIVGIEDSNAANGYFPLHRRHHSTLIRGDKPCKHDS